MKKKPVLIELIILLAGALATLHPLLRITASQCSAKLASWVDNWTRSPEDPPYLSLHYRLRTLYFSIELFPTHPVVFLGDSITYGGDWSQLFPEFPVKNRGIGGDSTLGLINRLDQVIALKPTKIFLMIGTNDLCYGRPIPDIVANYRKILNRFRTELPDTAIYIQNVLPFNDTIFPSRSLRTNRHIRSLNLELMKLASEYSYPYIDLASAFADPDGRLPLKYTIDGLHLNDSAYFVWREKIERFVAASSPAPAQQHSRSN